MSDPSSPDTAPAVNNVLVELTVPIPDGVDPASAEFAPHIQRAADAAAIVLDEAFHDAMDAGDIRVRFQQVTLDREVPLSDLLPAE